MKMRLKNLKNQTKHLAIIFSIIISSFVFCNNVKAEYYDNSKNNPTYTTNEPIQLNNKVGDVYKFILDNDDFKDTFFIEYKENGIYFKRGKFEKAIYTGSDFLKTAWVFAYAPEYNQLLVYLFQNNNNWSNLAPYFQLSNTKNNDNNYFDIMSYKVDISSYKSTPTRVKFSYISDTNNGVTTSTQSNAWSAFNWSIYGSNVSLSYSGNYYNSYLGEIVPEIEFSSENNIVNINGEEKISSVDLTIDYGIIDNDKYIYMYMYDDENIWNTYYLTESSSITLNINKNRHVIARVLDKETYEVVDNKTFTINNIDYDFNIDFNSETLKDNFGNVYQTNVTINYDSLNRDLFDYQYTTDYYVLEENQLWVSLDSDKSSVLLQNRDNINIIARIIEKSSGNVVYSKVYKIVQNIDKPKISFKAFNNLKYLGGADAFNNAQTIVESVDLTIDYGLMDNDNYAYMWKYYDENIWNTHYLLKSSIDLNITKNTTIVAQVINKNTNEIVTNATYTITVISSNPYEYDNNNFFDSVKDSFNFFTTPIQEILNMISYIWTGLNPIIQHFIIFIFIFLIGLFVFKFLI